MVSRGSHDPFVVREDLFASEVFDVRGSKQVFTVDADGTRAVCLKLTISHPSFGEFVDMHAYAVKSGFDGGAEDFDPRFYGIGVTFHQNEAHERGVLVTPLVRVVTAVSDGGVDGLESRPGIDIFRYL